MFSFINSEPKRYVVDMENPVLRKDIQPTLSVIEGRKMIRFQDPYHLGGSGIAVDASLLPLLQMLDGRNDIRDIQLALMKRNSGRMVYLSEVEAVVESLDRAFLLESDLFRETLGKIKREFLESPVRDCVHAGKSYPSDPEVLARWIEETEQGLPEGRPDGNVTGILAPHLDVQVAREAYVRAYRPLKGKDFDRVIVFGISHQSQNGLYCPSEKNYRTPFGEIRTDRDFIVELKKRVPAGALDPDDFGHRMEHSIEFQTLFLHHYLGASFTLVPVLCGGIHEFLFRRENLLADGRFLETVNVFQSLIQERRTLLVAGVDLSHVGHKFGDSMQAAAFLSQAMIAEQELLSSIIRGEPETIFEQAMENQDRFRVCGLPAILIFSALSGKSRGEVLCHETYDERATGSAVNYASMIFTKGA